MTYISRAAGDPERKSQSVQKCLESMRGNKKERRLRRVLKDVAEIG